MARLEKSFHYWTTKPAMELKVICPSYVQDFVVGTDDTKLRNEWEMRSKTIMGLINTYNY